MTPEHLHLALNHIPVIGLGCALVPLLIGLYHNQRATLVSGLLLAAASGWMTPLVMETGEEAYERYERGPVASLLDAGADEAMEIHEERAELWSVAMYVAAAVASFGLLVAWLRPSWLFGVGCLAVVACIAGNLAGIWVAESGGKIRRPDFRASAPELSAREEGHEREHSKHKD
jgi:hypothetical protein